MRKPNKKFKDRIRDKDVLKAYNRYETYLKELEIYEKYMQEMGKVNIVKLYHDIGIQDKEDIQARFQKLTSVIDNIKKENPDIDLKDIGTQEGRRAVSDIIYETQDDKEFKPSDLSDVAVIENLSLYSAVRDVNEKLKYKDIALVYYDLTEEQFNKAQESFKKYKNSEMMHKFNNRFKNSNSIVHYAAATLEETPVNVYEAFKRLGLEKGELTPKREKTLTAYKVSQLVIDNIMRDPKLTIEQKNAKINDLQLAEIDKKQKLADERNALKGTKAYKVVVEDKEER